MNNMAILGRLERASQQADHYRWCALALTTFCQSAAVSLYTAVGPLAPMLQAEFQVSRAQIGLIVTAVALSSAFVALVGGRAADRVGERRVLILSALIAGLAGLALSRADAFLLFLGFCFLLGLGSGIQNPAGSAAIMRWFPARQRGLAMGLRQTGVPLGGILAASLWPAVALAHGWRTAYLLGGFVTLFGATLIAVAYFDPARPAGAARAGPRPLRHLLADRQVWWLGLIFNVQVAAQFSATAYFVLFLHEVLDVSVVVASALLALINLVAIFARIGWGSLSDRRFNGRRRPVLVAILSLTLVSLLAAAALPAGAPLPLAVVLAVLLGISTFAWTGILGTLVIETVGRDSAASAIAVVTVLASPGSVLGPPLFGLIVDLAGSYRVAWLATAAAVLAGLFAIRQVTEDHGRPAP